MTHILPLSTLHSAAPGVLDVLFGRDGEFEGAPNWTGPILIGGRYIHVQAHRGQVGTLKGKVIDRDACHLDLRIPSVAARVAGLCARALGYPAHSAWVEAREDGCALHLGDVDRPFRSGRVVDLSALGLAPASDPAVFLSALFLQLAPRIAALGGSR